MEREGLISIEYDSVTIREKRESIRRELYTKSLNIQNGKIYGISKIDLRILFLLYDKYFFQGYFQENLKGKLEFSVSNRMTRAAGKTIFTRNRTTLEEKYEIRMALTFFQKYYEVNRNKKVSGIKTEDSLEAFMIVFEHELIHLLEIHVYNTSSCTKERFKILANRIFGHTSSYHELPTNKEIAYKKYGFKVGDRVKFDYNGEANFGIIHKINKRASVMVVDKAGKYVDREGNRYSKWYVPLEKIVK